MNRTLAEKVARDLLRREKYRLQLLMLECVARRVEDPRWRVATATEELEYICLREADLVFTTLSSTGRATLRRQQPSIPFKTVLVDEVCQATEPAVLQALSFGCEHAVLVGDPLQLPATVLSKRSEEGGLARSLFSRLAEQKLHPYPVDLLSVQYRMHPEIRRFPSRYFYQDRLVDAEGVGKGGGLTVGEVGTGFAHNDGEIGERKRTEGSVNTDHTEPINVDGSVGEVAPVVHGVSVATLAADLRPYRFYHVPGREQLHASGSLFNRTEANMALQLVRAIEMIQQERIRQRRSRRAVRLERDTLPPIDTTYGTDFGPIEVGIVTPYRQQCALLRAMIQDSRLGSSPGISRLVVETVDSFQGKQLDVVIFSCVRTGTAGQIGFLADERRLNVALTRAKKYLWVVGHAGALGGAGGVWTALLADVRQRELIFEMG